VNHKNQHKPLANYETKMMAMEDNYDDSGVHFRQKKNFSYRKLLIPCLLLVLVAGVAVGATLGLTSRNDREETNVASSPTTTDDSGNPAATET
jgi:hypothetical protein